MHSHSLLHSRASNPQDAFMCILGMLHSLHVAFQRILMHSQLDAFSNVLHLVHVIHSCALPYVCILNVMHISAFRCIHMRCILMHSNYDAFMCITVCMHSEPSLGAEPAPWEVCTLPDCVCELMHLNALECVRVCENA